MDTRVTQLLSTLGGVYRDPSRIDRDSSYLLKSSVGKHLKPNIGELVMNNGTNFNTVLFLQGTIAMTFRGQTYQQLVDIYLPPQYPLRPPVCFVRLGPNMYLKENHPHVGKDGMVYMPYLHEWRQHSHNLIELVVSMSSIFSNLPPVFTKSASQQQQEAQDAERRRRQSQPPPPSYNALSSSLPSSQSSSQAELESVIEQSRKEEEERNERERLAAVLEQSRKDEEERLKRVKEEEERKAKEQHDQWDHKLWEESKQKVTIKLQRHLLDVRNDIKDKIYNDHKDKFMLEDNTKQLEKQMITLKETKQTLQKQISTVDEKTLDIQNWLKESNEQKEKNNAKNSNSNNSQKQQEEIPLDELCIPASPLHNQMVTLSAESASITDVLYYLDKALIEHTIDIKTHMKFVRKLAKRQFLCKATLHKISKQIDSNDYSK